MDSNFNKRMLIVSDVPIFTIKKGIGIKVLEKTLKAFAKRGYDIDLVYPSYDENSDAGKDLNIKQVKDYSFYVPRYYKLVNTKYLSYISRSFFMLFFWLKLKKFRKSTLKNRRYDILYGIGPTGSFLIHRPYFGGNELKVSRFLGVSSLYKRYKTLLKKPLVYPQIFGFKVNSDLFIMTNDGTKGDEFIELVNPGAKNVYFFINGIDKSLFKKEDTKKYIFEKHEIDSDTQILLTVNRLSEQKRVDRSIKLLEQLPDDRKLCLIIVGDGTLRSELEELSKKIKSSHRVIFTGAVHHNEIVKYYNACDIFLSTNETNNAVNPLFEAMMTGCCIVTINNGDTADFVKKDSGILMEQNHLHKMPNVVAELLSNPVKRKVLGENARKHAMNTMQDWDERMANELDIIEQHL